MANNLYGLMVLEKRFRTQAPSREWGWVVLYVVGVAVLAWWWR